MVFNYQTTHLGEVCEIEMGQSPKGDTYNRLGHGMPLLNGPTEFGHSHPVSTLWTTAPTRLCKKGDILFCVRGSTTGRMNWAEREYCIGRGIGAFRAKNGPVDTRFVYYTLNNELTRLLSLCTGSVFPNLSRSDFEQFEINWPLQEERNAIAHILGTLDDKIELNRKMNETLEAIARAIFKSWFVDFDPVRAKAEGRQPYGMDAETAALFPDSFEDSELGKIPKRWKVGVFSEICQVALGGDWGQDNSFENSIEVRCLRGVDIGDLRQNGYADAPIRWLKRSSLEKRKLNSCDVLIAASGVGPLGRSIWIIDELHSIYQEPIIYSNFCKRFTAVSPEAALYLDRLLLNMHLSGDIWEYAIGTSVPNLDANGLLTSCKIVIPPDSVLSRYFDTVVPIYKRLYSGESMTLAAIRDALLPKLLSGEIRVNDAEEIVEGTI